MKTNYEIVQNQMTGDLMWKINDINLAVTDGGRKIAEQFIKENNHNDYSLSIYDELTKNTIEIEANISEIPIIVSYIYQMEHATPLTFIGVNSLSKSYVVGMNLAKGHIEFGRYKYVDGKLNKID